MILSISISLIWGVPIGFVFDKFFVMDDISELYGETIEDDIKSVLNNDVGGGNDGDITDDDKDDDDEEEEVCFTGQDNKFNSRLAPFDPWEDGKLGIISSS
jgi:hypothetical protein